MVTTTYTPQAYTGPDITAGATTINAGTDSPVTTSNTDASPTTTTTSTKFTSKSFKVTTKVSKTTSSSSVQTTTSSTQTSGSPSPATTGSTTTPFLQVVDASEVYVIDQKTFLSAPLDELCPGGNCFDACQDSARLYAAVPEGIQVDISKYGRLDSSNHANMTFFALCSNVQEAQSLSRASSAAAAYFPEVGASAAVSNITSDIAACFSGTCDATRDPSLCSPFCSADILIGNDSSALNMTNTGYCVDVLCSNTCGLPYADSDSFGVGVLISYFIQIGLVLLCAIALVPLSQRFKASRGVQAGLQAFEKPLKGFLAAQCFFGLTTSIAAISQLANSPTNPLAGYVLIFVAVGGFLFPIFTLMLFHACDMRSRSSTILVTLSWVLSTYVFFKVVRNLSGISPDGSAMQQGLQEVFEVPSCGGSSAMMLCQQMLGTNPLSYMTQFYNQKNIPNLKTVPWLWAWCTAVLIALISRQLWSRLDMFCILQWTRVTKRLRIPAIIADFVPIVAASGVFVLCISYYLAMVVMYKEMDLINWKNWGFGQVVACLLWLPFLIDVGTAIRALQRRTVPLYVPEYADASPAVEKPNTAGASPNIGMGPNGPYQSLASGEGHLNEPYNSTGHLGSEETLRYSRVSLDR